MDNKIAYCGIDCGECMAYKATVSDDNELRKKTAEMWSNQYNTDIKAESINCLGCRSELVFGYCSVCDIRKCAIDKGLDDCGKCSSFSCEKVEKVLKEVPGARKTLEDGRNT